MARVRSTLQSIIANRNFLWSRSLFSLFPTTNARSPITITMNRFHIIFQTCLNHRGNSRCVFRRFGATGCSSCSYAVTATVAVPWSLVHRKSSPAHWFVDVVQCTNQVIAEAEELSKCYRNHIFQTLTPRLGRRAVVDYALKNLKLFGYMYILAC